MATVAEIEEKIAQIKESIAILKKDIDSLDNDLIDTLDALAKAEASGDQNSISAVKAERRTYLNEQKDINAQIQAYQDTLRSLGGQLNNAKRLEAQAANPAPQPQPPATASQTAQDDAPQGPSATPQQTVNSAGRIVTTPEFTNPTNATPTSTTVTNPTVGTDDPVKTTEQTQSINTASNTGKPLIMKLGIYDASGNKLTDEQIWGKSGGEPTATTEAGNATKDDAGNNSTTTKQAEVNGAKNSAVQVTPQPNVLDQYPSYTYVASVYLMTNDQYKRIITTKNRKIDGYQLLFQSGGAPINVGGVKANNEPGTNDGTPGPTNSTTKDAGRSPFFDNDFFIDNISLETTTMGKGTGSAHLASVMRFTVCEPMGMTLFDRLYKAVENQQPKDSTGKVNYTSAAYLMVIRFYGYDEQGNIMMPLRGGLTGDSTTSDPKAVIEKFIPFQIIGINWTVGSKLTTYEWNCAPIGQLQGGYSGRGTVPYDVQLAAGTVGKLLKGNAQYAATTATTDARGRQGAATDPRVLGTPAVSESVTPAKANTAPTKKTVTQGLMGALNDFQDELVKQGVYTIPDRYSIEFVDGVEAKGKDIEEAQLQLPNTKTDKKYSPAGQSTTQDANNLRPETNAVDMVNRTFSITAGMSIIQAIEMSIRNSEFINKQQLIIVNPDGTYAPNPVSQDKNFQWFTISMSATPRDNKIDPKRNDYAYDIKYTVRPFLSKNNISKYFPPTKFSGVHKSYPYWFTGKNTAVLKYEESLNTLYQLTVSGDAKGSLADKQREAWTSSMLDMVKYGYAPRSNQSSQGADGKTNEPGANAAENLYSPGDLAQAQVRIVGDPAWIQQGSVYQDISSGTVSVDSIRTGFEPDGSISFDSQDILFEIAWQRPEDYDLLTGLADPFSGGYSGVENTQRTPIQSRIYQATKVVSDFKNGSFEQTVHGSLYLLPKKDATNTATPAAAGSKETASAFQRGPDQSDAETQRLKTAAAASAGKALDAKIQQNSITSSKPTSAIAQGVQSILQPPTAVAEPTLTQLQSSPAYIAARRAGQTPAAALQAARNSFATFAGGSPVVSNGQPVASSGSPPPGRLSAGQTNAELNAPPQEISREA